MDKIKTLLPGILFVYMVALVSRLLGPLLNIEPLTIGILLGIFIAGIAPIPKVCRPGIAWCQKPLLSLGIILLGFRLNFDALLSAGLATLVLVIFFVPMIITIGLFLGRAMGAGNKLSALLGIGTAICGSSAIAAVAPTMGAEEEDVVVAVSVVSILGALGVVIYSALALVYPGTDTSFGTWSGLTLHNVPHALAAAFARGELAGEIGTVVKLTRVLMLIPTALVLGAINRKQGSKLEKGFPMYVFYFAMAALTGWLLPIPVPALELLGSASTLFITMAIIAMGLGVNFKSLLTKGRKAALTGTLLFIISSTSALFLLHLLIR